MPSSTLSALLDQWEQTGASLPPKSQPYANSLPDSKQHGHLSRLRPLIYRSHPNSTPIHVFMLRLGARWLLADPRPLPGPPPVT
jgi:hypothetical protein